MAKGHKSGDLCGDGPTHSAESPTDNKAPKACDQAGPKTGEVVKITHRQALLIESTLVSMTTISTMLPRFITSIVRDTLEADKALVAVRKLKEEGGFAWFEAPPKR